MPTETELKLTIPPAQMTKLQRHPQLAAWAQGRARRRVLYSVYYDTPELELHRARMALRLRRDGARWVQTLKGGGKVAAGLHHHHEWEMAVAGEALELEALLAQGAALSAGVAERLQPVFVTDFTRVVRLLRFEGAEIELCLDRGAVRAGGKEHVISEVELELKSGKPLQLFRLALALQDIVPLKIELTSKAEHGYRLFTGNPPVACRVTLPRLEATQPVAQALEALCWSAMQHLQANVPGFLAAADGECLHQMRIALRRLRLLLAVCARHDDSVELASLRTGLRQLGKQLGCLREWDVLLGETLAAEAGEESLPLRAACATARAACHAEVAQILMGQAFQRLLLHFGAWMYGTEWQAGARPTALPLYAAALLQREYKQVARRAEGLPRAAARQLHALRIACKRLRYSAEMFGSLFPVRPVRRFQRAVGELQEVLGVMQDIVVARRLLKTVCERQTRAVVRAVRRRLKSDHAALRRRLRMVWRGYAAAPRFWC